MKNAVIIILILLLAGGWYFLSNESEDLIKTHRSRIDSLRAVNNVLKMDITTLKGVALIKDEDQEELEKEADSLASLLDRPHTCPEVVDIQEKEITALRGALTECKEAKAIYVKSVGLCMDMNINHEIITVNQSEMMAIDKKQFKKEKRRSFFKGAGAGGAAIGLLILLLL